MSGARVYISSILPDMKRHGNGLHPLLLFIIIIIIYCYYFVVVYSSYLFYHCVNNCTTYFYHLNFIIVILHLQLKMTTLNTMLINNLAICAVSMR